MAHSYPRPDDSTGSHDFRRETDRLLLTRYAPPAVVVNDQMEIIQTRGRTGSYLKLASGKASLNLLRMARPGLLFDLQEAIEEARQKGAEVERRNLHVQDDRGTHVTNIRVIPLQSANRNSRNYVITFEMSDVEGDALPVPSLPLVLPEPLTESERSDKERQITGLRHELSATKDYLQSIIEMQEVTTEELQTANEGIQSANEELQSTNEELQTSREELESANEELQTLNEEMQHRNDILTQISNDQINLINSINLPVIMLSADLSVRRFTPQAAAQLGLQTADIGRTLPDLGLKIDTRWLEQVIVEVMRDVRQQQHSVQTEEGDWFSLRITPYRTLGNRIEGVVLTLIEAKAQPAGDQNGAGANGQSTWKKSSPPANKK